MKIIALSLMAIAYFATSAKATMQVPDTITYDEITYNLYDYHLNGQTYYNLPLEKLWMDPKKRPKFDPVSTACWRSYIAKWEIEEGILYLRVLQASQDGKPVEIKAIFPKRFKNGRVKADWFSGSLLMSPTVDFDDHSDIILNIKDGKITPNNVAN